MDSEISNWEEWPRAECYAEATECPTCRQPLVIMRMITSSPETYYTEATEYFDAICPHCKLLFMLCCKAGELLVDPIAASNAIRIIDLEERVASLEAIVKKLTEELSRRPTAPIARPDTQDTQNADPEAEAFRKKYGYLF